MFEIYLLDLNHPIDNENNLEKIVDVACEKKHYRTSPMIYLSSTHLSTFSKSWNKIRVLRHKVNECVICRYIRCVILK